MTRKQLRHWSLWAAVVFGVIAALMSSLYYRSFHFPEDGLAQLFVLLAFPGHFVFLAFVLSLPALLVSQLVPNAKLTGVLLALFLAPLLVLVAVDIKVFELFRFHLNSMVWELFAGGAADDIFEFSLTDLILIGSIVLGSISLVLFAIWGARYLAMRTRNWGRVALPVCLLVMLAGQLLYAWADAFLYKPVVRQLPVIPWAQPLTAKSFFEKQGWIKPRDIDIDLAKSSKGILNYPKGEFSCQAQGEAPNLLVIMVDSLRHDVVTPEIMPVTHELIQRGSIFENHYSTGNATRFGVFGFFYGLYGSYWHVMLSENQSPVLIQSLKANDYEFGVFASAKLTSPEFDRTVFASVRDQIALKTPGSGKAARDYTINERFLSFLDERDPGKPFFGMLFYDAAHGYTYPDDFELKFTPVLENVSYVELNKDSDPQPFFNRYKNSTYFIDGLIDEVLQGLKAQQLLENTIIVVTSDHGQEFNDTGANYWGHNGNFSEWQTKVPMAIVYPDGEPKRYQHLTSHVDVASTLMRDVLGCENRLAQYTQGKYLDDPSERDLLLINSWSRFAVFDGQKTAVLHKNGITEMFGADYQPLRNEEPDTQKLLKVMQLNSEFLQ